MAADSTTDTGSEDSGDSTPAPRKIGQAPTYEMTAEDQAIFDKHFGGDDEAEEKPAKAKEPKAKAPAKDDKASKKEPKEPEAKPAKKPPPKVEATEEESDEAEEEGDDGPETSAKARELFKKAKAAKTPIEARRFYKQAMKEAFGEVPDEFNDARYAASRQADAARKVATEKERRELDEKAQTLQTTADKWVQQLRPAYHVMEVLKKVSDGDWTAMGDLIERACPGVTRDEAIKRFVKGIKESPEQVQARRRAHQTQQVESASLQRIAELEKKLEEKDKAKENEARRARAAVKREQYEAELTEELSGHLVAKLPGGIKRVLKLLVKTADPKLRTPTKTPEQAADLIVAFEKRRLKASRHLLDDGEAAPAPREEKRAPAVSRSHSTNPGAAPEYNPDEAFDRLWAKHNPPKGRRR
jgi:hypothetical protein